MNGCDYPNCYLDATQTVNNKALCGGHALEYRAFLVYHGWAVQTGAALIMRDVRKEENVNRKIPLKITELDSVRITSDLEDPLILLLFRDASGPAGVEDRDVLVEMHAPDLKKIIDTIPAKYITSVEELQALQAITGRMGADLMSPQKEPPPRKSPGVMAGGLLLVIAFVALLVLICMSYHPPPAKVVRPVPFSCDSVRADLDPLGAGGQIAPVCGETPYPQTLPPDNG